jgi:hypothetical protein
MRRSTVIAAIAVLWAAVVLVLVRSAAGGELLKARR